MELIFSIIMFLVVFVLPAKVYCTSIKEGEGCIIALYRVFQIIISMLILLVVIGFAAGILGALFH